MAKFLIYGKLLLEEPYLFVAVHDAIDIDKKGTWQEIVKLL